MRFYFACCLLLPNHYHSSGLDFAPVDASHLKDDSPIVVVQHGLTGGKIQRYPSKVS